jgi:endonuclease/exonuclease/phosphatase family metal-dependent hydrolase
LKASESLIHADIDVNGQTIRVFATHLESLRFDEQDYEAMQTFSKGEKKVNVLKKFQLAYWYRGEQAQLVKSELDKSPYPLILCGDFNDVPNSYTYSTIRGTRNDAFLAAGFGIGRTFASLSPTLRIDYIFSDTYFKVGQFKKTKIPWSDHYPLVADLILPPAPNQKAGQEP